MFLKSVDASDKVKSSQLICEMMQEVVQEVGEQNVVHIVTENATKVAGSLLNLCTPPYSGPFVLYIALT